jgi:hypothetical protein
LLSFEHREHIRVRECSSVPEHYTDAEIVAVARKIRNYLQAHPEAADSLEGIVAWWLTRQRYEESLANVQTALEHLIATGVVSKCTRPDGHIIYSSARKRGDPG